MTDQIQIASMLPYLLPFASAFFGATAAFWLGRVKQKQDEKERRHGALLATQYALVSQQRMVGNLKRQVLEPLRNDPVRFTKLRHFIPVRGEIYIPIKDLTFIIDSDEPNLLQDIHTTEQSFLLIISLLENYNQVRAELFKKFPPKSFDMEVGKGAVEMPVHEAYVLKNAADLLYDQVDKTFPQFDERIGKVFTFIKRNFKGKKGLKTAPLESISPSKPKE